MTRYALVKDGDIISPNVQEPNVDQTLLAEGKPRRLPVVTVGAEFDPVSQVREGPDLSVDGDTVVESWTVRDKNADEIAEMKSAKVAVIKAEARRRILAVMPEHAQLNALALGQEMTLLHGPDPSGWPTQALAVYAEVMPKWAVIKAIRAASDAMEADVASLDTPAEIAGYDISTGWE